MKFLILILTLYTLFSAIRYSIYEFKKKNKPGGIIVCTLGIFQCIFTNSMLFILNR